MRKSHLFAAAMAALYSAILYIETGEAIALFLSLLSLIPLLIGWYFAKKASGNNSGSGLD